MDELRIDEELLNECLEFATVGEHQHRGIKGILEMIALAGYRWRTPFHSPVEPQRRLRALHPRC